ICGQRLRIQTLVLDVSASTNHMRRHELVHSPTLGCNDMTIQTNTKLEFINLNLEYLPIFLKYAILFFQAAVSDHMACFWCLDWELDSIFVCFHLGEPGLAAMKGQ
ncbi:hypothetical protein ACJX0J_010456, partial [Zea mays]